MASLEKKPTRPVPERPAGFDPAALAISTNINREGATRVVPMKVLCLGLSRTGTSSLKQALLDLGIGDVYHFSSVINDNPPDAFLWARALDWKINGIGTWTKSDWDALLGHCMAVSDHPCLAFCDELLETYPDAKVILTTRDNVDVWYESVMATIWPFVRRMVDPDVSVWRKIWRAFLDPTGFDRMHELIHLNPEGMYWKFPERGKDFYRKHNEKIRRMAPKEKLLEYNVKQGWEPLCEFLGYEAPEWEFPRVNEKNVFIAHRQSFMGNLNLVVAKNMVKYLGSALVLGVGAWLAVKLRP